MLTSRALAFELVLLSRMTEEYKIEMLHRAGLSIAESEMIRRTSPLQYPSLFQTTVDVFDGLLSKAAQADSAGIRSARQFPGAEVHVYNLELWPHLCWVVHAGSDGRVWGGEFQPRCFAEMSTGDLTPIKPRESCRSTMERVAENSSLVDGWDESVVLEMTFYGERFLCSFVFGLLQDWRPSDFEASR